MSAPPPYDHAASAAVVLLVEELIDDLDGLPTLAEFLAVMGWSLPPSEAVLGAGLRAPCLVVAELDGTAYSPAAAVRTAEVGDAAYAVAGDLMGDLVDRWAAAPGAAALNDFLDAEVRAALNAVAVRLADCDTSRVTGLRFRPGRRVRRPRRGDVLAVPAKAGPGFHPAVVTGHDRFGMSVGFFRGTVSPASVMSNLGEVAWKRHLYVDDDVVTDGVVPIVGHDDTLPARFADAAEIYHAPGDGEGIGEFGDAETAGGRSRPLSEAEARDAGVLDGTYLQFPELFQIQQMLADLP